MSEFEEILNALENCRAKYMLVGGHAVMFYTEPRFTKDLDIFIEPSEENALKVFECLRNFGAPLAGLTPKDFQYPGYFYQMGRPPLRIDVLTAIDGVSFDEAWQGRLRVKFGAVEINIIGREQLIRNKRATARHIDLHDADQLELGIEQETNRPDSK